MPTRLAAYMTQSQDGAHDVDADTFAAEIANGAARLVMLSDLSTGGALVQAAGPRRPSAAGCSCVFACAPHRSTARSLPMPGSAR
ncbi:hypothetical protein AWV80_35175 [Cupriavidus sp. UYMU48A]|nr:hypothetical protein AWV80_35175 [Cupriavidus sp. UYMU48A]